ncbi:MAG: UvrD-helicase domain-containing protein [Myxococcota bacterium]|jgi:ATP-dependent helicase/nuclease subunit A|nr:UvrD-helicase domain-containing protein [Myxococcota bacterium]
MMKQPIDQTQRTQAIEAIGESIALEAGAGAGKTSVLVARVLRLLAADVEPARIAAITFTERAAGELQVRVREELERQARVAKGEARARYERSIEDLPKLRTSTIHAFCKSLLEAEALDAAWAPDTRLVTNGLDGGLFAAAFASWRADYRETNPTLDDELRPLASDSQLGQAARVLLSERDLRPSCDLETPPWELAWSELGEIATPLATLHSTACLRTGTCELYRQLIPALSLLSEAKKAGPSSIPVLLSALPKLNLRSGKAGDWKPNACAQVKALEKELMRWREDCFQAWVVPIHGRVVRSLWESLVPTLQKQRRANGQADFSDLLQRALELLETQPGARRRLAASFDAILIDEVQDTDPVQSRIALLLSRPLEAEGAWNAHPPLPGKLFAVGDPKQSIYRFRRADVAMWAELGAAITNGGGQKLRLAQNFRSVPGLVAWCNFAFSEMPGFEPQVAARPAAALDPVVLLRTEDDEPDALVRYLWTLRAGNPALKWSDVMVLLPAWSCSDELQTALLASGIPCLIEGGTAFAKRDEVRLAIAALRALNEPSDSEAIVFVLRGLFGLSHEELAKHVAAEGAWRYTIRPRPATLAAEALELLDSLHRRRGKKSWVALLDELLSATQAPAVWAMTPRGSAAIANLDKFRVLVRQVEAETRSPDGAVTQIRELLRERDEDLPLGDYDSDAVRITTYFKAKGREAPVVALVAAKRAKDPIRYVVDRKQGALAIKVAQLTPPKWESLLEQEQEAAADERRRWMYVAATRARDQLVIVQHPKNSPLLAPDITRGLPEQGSHGVSVALAPGVTVRVLDHDALPEASYTRSAFPGVQPRIEALLAAEPAALKGAETAAPSKALTQGCARWQSVTERLGRRVARAPIVVSGATEDASGKMSRDGGTLVHAVLERLDLKATRDSQCIAAKALLGRMAKQQNRDATFTAKCEHVLLTILDHEVFDRARCAPEVWQETPFSMRVDNTIVSGSIDLCFPLDESRHRWLVADYKSGMPKPGTPAHARYQEQLAYYAKALIALVEPCTEVETVLVGPHPELPTAFEDVDTITDPELREGVLDLLERGLPPPRVGYEPDLDGEPMLELAWPEQSYGVLLDRPSEETAMLEAAGWTLHVAQSTSEAWVAAALAALSQRFGLVSNTELPDDAGTGDEPEANTETDE